MRLLFFSFFLVFTFCSIPLAWGQDTINTSDPIRIEADRMESSQGKNVIVFSGNVHANQDDLVINADSMTVRYHTVNTGKPDDTTDVPAEGLPQQIDTITAKGKVKIVRGDWIANGDSMDFKADKRLVILSGNAKAWQDQNMVSGEKIILYLDEGKSVVERSTKEGERVKAFIYPASQEDKGDNDPSQKQ